jgi:hypothetical protein
MPGWLWVDVSYDRSSSDGNAGQAIDPRRFPDFSTGRDETLKNISARSALIMEDHVIYLSHSLLAEHRQPCTSESI